MSNGTNGNKRSRRIKSPEKSSELNRTNELMRNNSFQPDGNHDLVDMASALQSNGQSVPKNGFESEKFTDITDRYETENGENGPRSRNSRLNQPERGDFQAHSPLIDLNRTKLESGDENWIPLDSIEAKDDVLHEVYSCVIKFRYYYVTS